MVFPDKFEVTLVVMSGKSYDLFALSQSIEI